MTKQLLTLALCMAAICSREQQLTPQVLASGGAFGTGGGYTLSYTVGEMAAVATYNPGSGSPILTQGFQQADFKPNGIDVVTGGANGQFAVYPVPATGNIWFGYEFDQPGHIAVELYDITGRKLDFTYNEAYTNGKVTYNFDCSTYASGNYVLVARFTATGGDLQLINKKIQFINN